MDAASSSAAGLSGVSLLDARQTVAYFATDYARGWAGLRDGCWKDLLELESRRSHLFDVCLDPGERHDLSTPRAREAAAFRERTLDWTAATRRSMLEVRAGDDR